MYALRNTVRKMRWLQLLTCAFVSQDRQEDVLQSDELQAGRGSSHLQRAAEHQEGHQHRREGEAGPHPGKDSLHILLSALHFWNDCCWDILCWPLVSVGLYCLICCFSSLSLNKTHFQTCESQTTSLILSARQKKCNLSKECVMNNRRWFSQIVGPHLQRHFLDMSQSIYEHTRKPNDTLNMVSKWGTGEVF